MSASRGQDALLSPDSVLHRAAERLTQSFAGMVGEETVERVVFESYVALGRTAAVQTHLASLAEKFARDRLPSSSISTGSAPCVTTCGDGWSIFWRSSSRAEGTFGPDGPRTSRRIVTPSG